MDIFFPFDDKFESAFFTRWQVDFFAIVFRPHVAPSTMNVIGQSFIRSFIISKPVDFDSEIGVGMTFHRCVRPHANLISGHKTKNLCM